MELRVPLTTANPQVSSGTECCQHPLGSIGAVLPQLSTQTRLHTLGWPPDCSLTGAGEASHPAQQSELLKHGNWEMC